MVLPMSQLPEDLFKRMDYNVKECMLLLNSDLYSFVEEACLCHFTYK